MNQSRLRSIRESWEDPAKFNTTWLGRYPYWEKQEEVCQALREGKETILVPSGHATGKSWMLAGLALAFLASKSDPIVVTTASTNDQLEGILWRAIFKAYDQAPVKLFNERSTRSPLLLENLDNGGYAIGLSTRKQEGTTGHHTKNLLVIVDEASGVEADRFSALNSLNPQTMILIGNPIIAEGEFHERIARQELDPDPKTALIRIRSDETPPVKAGIYRSETGLADLQFLERSRRDYGEGSPWWMSHVEARAPDSAEGQVFASTWIDLAIMAPKPNRLKNAGGPLWMGVDIATGRGGDHSVIVIRDDLGITYLESSNTVSIVEWAAKAAGLALSLGIPAHRVVYDKPGVGETFGDLLAQNGLPYAIGFQGGSGTSDKFENLRAAAYWVMGRRFNPAVSPVPFSIPPEYGTRLRREMQATTYKLTSKDKIQIKEKDLIAARIGHSPDWADALMQTYAYDAA